MRAGTIWLGVAVAIAAAQTPPGRSDAAAAALERGLAAYNAISIGWMLQRLGGSGELKIGSDATFHDLRSRPSILIGYSYTRWHELNRGLRYSIDTAHWPKGISDRGKPTPWHLPPMSDNRRVAEDYAIVARMLHPDTGKLLVLVAGVEGYGTESAADLLTHEDRLATALRGAPPDWPRRNLELVLHVKVISGEAGFAQPLALHCW